MHCRLAAPGSGSGVFARVLGAALTATLAACTFSTAHADILHLTNGGSVEGTIVEQDERCYKVRTTVGTVTLPIDAVDRIERRPSVLDEYVKLREKVADTPAAQVELAKWCGAQDLQSARRSHLRRAIELDADCEPARIALGFVRVAGMWVEGRTADDHAETGPDRKKTDQDAASRDDEDVVAAIQSQWAVRIRAIKNNKLETSIDRLVQDGRRRIVEIRDPLAILPLTRLLGAGNWACRDALVEVLGHFPQDEATLNLAVMALTDRDDRIRQRTLAELKRRDDPRVVPQFRRALASDSDPLIRRASIGLGTLQAGAAIPDLIDVLKARRRKLVEVSVRRYFGEYLTTFDTPTVISLGNVSHIRHSPVLGIPAIGTGLVFVDSEYQMRDVTVFRTEVLEALKQITGENFGFDEAAWRRWYEEEHP